MNSFSSYEHFWSEIHELKTSDILDNVEFLKPNNRSSTIFPIFKDRHTQTSIKFLSYWLKKHGNNVIARLTTRDLLGAEINKKFLIITTCKAFNYVISDQFPLTENGFCGSVEVEIFSETTPLFTFPAITVSYSTRNSCSVVHGGIRTYNSTEKINDYALQFPQTGFDVNIEMENKNFICFFGGNSDKYSLKIELQENGNTKFYIVEFQNDCHGQSHIFYLEDIMQNQDIKLFKSPKCVIHHNLKDVFPRFYVGIRHKNFAPTLTHTFFDTSESNLDHDNSNYSRLRANNSMPDKYFDSAFSVPIYPTDIFDTSIQAYDQNLKFSGTAIASIYSNNGELKFSRSLTDGELIKLCGIGDLNLNKFILEAQISKDKSYSLCLAFVDKKIPFPNRFKLGLNVKRKKALYGSNICFAPLVTSENTLSKPFSRRWFPIGGPQKYIASIHNTALNRLPNDENTECVLEFFNHQGDTILERKAIQENASIFIDPSNDEKLSNFLDEREGWCMVTSSTYLCDAYYFCMADTQIGGDHAF
ncbi:hypothetical protein OAN52_06780 [Amylibacter sp.]|jgi:hypothetical protein|nr:hypothetical protein [Amylibacter sp.]